MFQGICYIAPCGEVNVKTGKFQYGQFYGFWGDNTCYEVHRITKGSRQGNLRIVATSGTTPICKVGDIGEFVHDQTGKGLFTSVCIDTAIGDAGFRELGEKYGNNLNVSTYK